MLVRIKRSRLYLHNRSNGYTEWENGIFPRTGQYYHRVGSGSEKVAYKRGDGRIQEKDDRRKDRGRFNREIDLAS
jgi:hypothetical protein